MSCINPVDVSSVSLTQATDLSKESVLEEKAKKDFAQKFESLIMNKLLESMENTIPESGFEKDSASKQVKGMYWMFMSQAISKEGGIGLADEIYNSLSNENKSSKASLIDQKA